MPKKVLKNLEVGTKKCVTERLAESIGTITTIPNQPSLRKWFLKVPLASYGFWTISGPSQNHLKTISTISISSAWSLVWYDYQRTWEVFTGTINPFCIRVDPQNKNVVKTISKPSQNHLKTISKPSQNHLKTISNHLKPSQTIPVLSQMLPETSYKPQKVRRYIKQCVLHPNWIKKHENTPKPSQNHLITISNHLITISTVSRAATFISGGYRVSHKSTQRHQTICFAPQLNQKARKYIKTIS